MGFQLPTGSTLGAQVQTSATLTFTILGTERTDAGVETAEVLYQGQAATSVGVIYTVPATTMAYVNSIFVVNTAASVQTFSLFLGGTIAGNRITPTISIPADGFASYGDAGWQVYDENGILQTGIAP